MKTRVLLYILFIALSLVWSSCRHNHKDAHTHAHEHSAHQHEHENCEHEHKHEEHMHGDCTHEHSHEGHSHEHDGCEHEHSHSHAHSAHSHEAHNHNHAHEHAHAHGSHDASNLIHFREAMQKKIDFSIEKVELANIGSIIKTQAQICPAPNSKSCVLANASGKISFPENFALSGKEVKKGEILFYIESHGIGEENLSIKFKTIENQYKKAKADYERKLPLFQEKIISQNEFLEVETNYKNLENQYNTFKANYSNNAKIKVTANASGYIGDIFIENGSFVNIGDELLDIYTSDKSLLKLEVSPRYADELEHIEDANFGKNKDFKSLKELNGKLVSVGKNTSLNNPLIPVHFLVQSPKTWINGSFIDAYISCKSKEKTLCVSNSALVEEMGNFFVFVRISKEEFEKRQIEIGKTNGIKTQVLGGLKPSETIVCKGAASVRSAQASAALDPHAGHSH